MPIVIFLWQITMETINVKTSLGRFWFSWGLSNQYAWAIYLSRKVSQSPLVTWWKISPFVITQSKIMSHFMLIKDFFERMSYTFNYHTVYCMPCFENLVIISHAGSTEIVQWNLSWEIIAMKDHLSCLSWKKLYTWQNGPTFQYNWTRHQKKHLPWEINFMANGGVFQDRFYCSWFDRFI